MSGTDELITDYLEELDRELAALPRAARREVVDEISTHIAEARAEVGENEPEIRAMLDRLGEPADIAADARERFGVRSRKRTWMEVAVLVLLPIGGVIIPVVGWLAGVVLLWVSDAWTTRDKLLGTLVIPGGLLTPLLMVQTLGSAETCISEFGEDGHLLSQSCSGGASDFERIFWPALFVVLALAPIAMTVYLARRSGRARMAIP